MLVLGAGYVSAPLVEYLNRESNVTVTVGRCLAIKVNSLIMYLNFMNSASALKDEADALAKKFEGVESVLLDVVGRPDILTNLIRTSDVVVSLLPYALHPKVTNLIQVNLRLSFLYSGNRLIRIRIICT